MIFTKKVGWVPIIRLLPLLTGVLTNASIVYISIICQFWFFCDPFIVFRKRLFPPTEEPEKVKEKKISNGSSLSFPHNHRGSCNQLDKETDEFNDHTKTDIQIILERNDTGENNNTNINFENEITTENINPIQVFRSLEIKESGDIRTVNRSLQKQKLADENKIFRLNKH